MELTSQKMRKLAPELDPLRIGTGWTREELGLPQIYIGSTFGDSHPGSGHLDRLVEAVREGIHTAGGKGARYFCTDMCDGESQGTDGINYSLVSREMIANMIEIQANATPFDGAVYLASCDKGMPGCLMGMARVNVPSVVVPGGVILVDSTLVDRMPERDDVSVYAIDATRIAEENGLKGLANIVLVGKLFEATGFCGAEALEAGIRKAVPPKKAALIEKNLQAVEIGRNA